MQLILGGYAQGKRAYVKEKYHISDEEICSGDEADFETLPGKKVYNNMHLWLKRKMEQGADIPALMEQFLKEHPDCILICDEVGNGIVPVADTERAYREMVGRMLCLAAERADSVERVICGIAQKIK